MDKARLLSQAPHGKVELLVQFVKVAAHQVPHLDILQVVPTTLIPGVQIRRIPRQGLQRDAAASARHEFPDRHAPVDRRAIPDHQQSLPRHAEQMQEELDAMQPVERLRPDQGVDPALRRHPAHDREVIPSLLLAEHRRQSLRGIRLDHPRQEVEARFVLENQGPVLPAGTPPQLRPGLLTPPPDGVLVPLDGPPDRLLRSPTQVLEEPADVTLVIADAELPLDDLGDAGAGPDLAAEPVRLRPVPEEFGDQPPLLGGEPRRGPRCGASPERLGAVGPGVGQPAADRNLGNIQGLGDIALIPAPSLEVQRPEPPPLEAFRRDGMGCIHPSILLLSV